METRLTLEKQAAACLLVVTCFLPPQSRSDRGLCFSKPQYVSVWLQVILEPKSQAKRRLPPLAQVFRALGSYHTVRTARKIHLFLYFRFGFLSGVSTSVGTYVISGETQLLGRSISFATGGFCSLEGARV